MYTIVGGSGSGSGEVLYQDSFKNTDEYYSLGSSKIDQSDYDYESGSGSIEVIFFNKKIYEILKILTCLRLPSTLLYKVLLATVTKGNDMAVIA